MPKKGYKQTEKHIKNNSKANLGKHSKPLSKDHRFKIKTTSILRGVNIGNKNGMYGKCGENSPTWRRSHTDDERKHMSIKMTNRMIGKHRGEDNPMFGMRGELAPSWKGGISFEPYCPKFNKEFKNRIRAFFGYKCVECGKTQKELDKMLDVHHVNYDKMVCCNDTKPIFVALCHAHNTIANNSREYWEKHYTDIVNNKYGGQCYLPRIK